MCNYYGPCTGGVETKFIKVAVGILMYLLCDLLTTLYQLVPSLPPQNVPLLHYFKRDDTIMTSTITIQNQHCSKHF